MKLRSKVLLSLALTLTVTAQPLLATNAFASTSTVGTSSVQGVYKSLSVTCFQQEKDYWCAPATVKQTLHYLNGKSSSQSTYATQLKTTTSGTDMTLIPGVLNKNTSKHSYSYMSIGSYGDYTTKVYNTLATGSPVVIDIKATGKEGWPYSTNGHFINVSGIDFNSSHSQLKVTDPWKKGLGNHWYDASLVYKVNNQHFRKAMIG